MKKLDWEQIQEIFHQARKLPPAQRRAFVENACEDDSESASEIMDLLDHDDDPFPEPPINLPLTARVDDLVGQTIGERYFVEKELGGGGMSRVYLARDGNVHGRAVVLKVLSRELLENPYARQKFEQEVEALIRIDHSGVVDVFDRKSLPDGSPYFVMQFINGNNLRSLIRSEGMNLERAASILKQIGEALNQVHDNGIVHRDLKPENIMLRRGTDSVVLIDFGIAKVTDSIVAPTTTHGPSAGTLRYMSREQLLGEEVTAASDIYSMAVIAYEMVTGRQPFDANSEAELVEQQRKHIHLKPRVLRRNLSAEAQEMILRGLSIKPQARYQNAKQFGDSLANVLLAKGVQPRSPWVNVVAVALLILIGGVTIYYNRPAPPKSTRSEEASPKPMLSEPTRSDVIPPKPTPSEPVRSTLASPTPTPSKRKRSFKYYLTVQPMRDGKAYQNPFKAHGEETFSTGDQFQLTVVTPVPAYLYIFKEGRPEPNDTSFKMIYPRRTINNGSASLGPDQPIQSDWFTFKGPAGAENFWFVWSTSPVPELESAMSEIFKQNGGLTGQTLVTVKQYLTTKEAEINATTYNFKKSKNAVVRGEYDLLVALDQFKHH